MKIPAKILLLILAVVVAVGAVLIFVKTQLAPPVEIANKDPYGRVLDAELKLVESKSFPESRRYYEKAADKLKVMNREGLISNEKTDETIVKLDKIYAKEVINYAYRLFSYPTWPENKLKEISDAVYILNTNVVRTGKRTVTPDIEKDFLTIDNVMTDYHRALDMTNDWEFRGLPDAELRLKNLEKYAERPYLSNNATLRNAINKFTVNLSSSHYNYLMQEVERLGDYRNMSQGSFNALIGQISRMLNDYRDTGIYGSYKTNVDSLFARANELVGHGNYYYASGNVYVTPPAETVVDEEETVADPEYF